MDILTLNDLREFVGDQDSVCLSIFIPTYRAGADIQKSPIKLKNQLKQAEEQLLAAKVRRRDVASLLEPIERLLPDSLFWKHQSDGLAVFRAQGFMHSYRLPVRFKELVVVGRRFHLKPLLPFLSHDGHFYILALSQNQIRLIGATRQVVDEVELEGLPTSLAEALGDEDPQRHLQFHTRAPSRSGQRDAMFHGHGEGGSGMKERIRRYFQMVDRGLQTLLAGERSPMVLAGVDYLLPLFRQVTAYPAVLDEGIVGNPENLRADELHARAWALVEPAFRRGLEDALSRCQQLAGTERLGTRLEDVVRAAFYGQVEDLLVAEGVEVWGHFDPQTGEVQRHDQATAHNEDLLDFSALHTLINGGMVHVVAAKDLAAGEHAAAILRY